MIFIRDTHIISCYNILYDFIFELYLHLKHTDRILFDYFKTILRAYFITVPHMCFY